MTSDTMPIMKKTGNFFLIGLMGAGKTTVGRALSKKTGRVFYDSDQEIELRTGVKIATIFDIEGETRFRERESTVIQDLTAMQNIILATGGGAILNPDNRALLANRGFVIYLRAPIEDLLQRTLHDKNRPLLQTANPRERLETLFQERDPLYRSIADMIVDTTQQNINHLVHQLVSLLPVSEG